MRRMLAALALALSAGAMSAFVAGNADVGVAATVFCGVFVQALPFLVLGVVVSGLIAAFVYNMLRTPMRKKSPLDSYAEAARTAGLDVAADQYPYTAADI